MTPSPLIPTCMMLDSIAMTVPFTYRLEMNSVELMSAQ